MTTAVNMWCKVTLEDEFKKNPELKAEDIQDIQSWVKSQPHLPPMTDQNVVLILHANEWNLDETKKCIEMYFTYKTSFTGFFADRNPLSTEIQDIAKVVNVAFLEHNDVEGNRIIWCSLKDPEPSHYNFAAFVKYFNMITEVFQLENGTAPGFAVVYDVKNFCFTHMFKFPLSQVSKYIKYGQEAATFPIKAVHYLHVNTLLNTMMALTKHLLKPKVVTMINMHSNVESLHKAIPKEVMPKDYGGEQPTMEEMNDQNLRKLADYKQFFQEEQKIRVDESKRVSKKGK